jgi:membrane protease YdiL (CAAX protease family)
VSIALFIILAFGFSWAIWLTLGALGVSFGTRAALGMFGPAITCLLVRLLRREGFSDAGLLVIGLGVRGGGRLYLAAYCVPIMLLVVGLALSLLLGIQHWQLPAYLQATHTSPLGLALICLRDLTLVIPTIMFFTFGEELGWRGSRWLRLSPLGGVTAAIIVGIIWGLWHAPLIFVDGYEYGAPHSLTAVLMFKLPSTTLSLILAWLRFRTGSIWPAVLAHAMGNQAAVLALLAFVTPGNLYLGTPVGLSVAFAIWLVATGRLNPEPPQGTETTNGRASRRINSVVDWT